MVLQRPKLPHTERSHAGSVAGSEAVSVAKLVYSVSEAAEALGVSRATMYALIHREGFPTLKVGGRRLISCELLAEWVRREASKSQTGHAGEINSLAYKEIRSQL